jgi:hypothetical protein
MLSATPIISPDPIVVFTGPVDHPDTVEQFPVVHPKAKKKTAKSPHAKPVKKAKAAANTK